MPSVNAPLTSPAAAEPAPAPFHENIPRQCLALGGWVLFWMAAEHLLRRWGLGPRHLLIAPLGVLAAAALGARGWLFRLATSVRFALAQGAFLIGAVLLAAVVPQRGPAPGPRWAAALADTTRCGEVFRSLWFGALLAALAASMLAVTWKRRPYPLARLGFLLVHVAPALMFLGLLWGRLAGVRTQEWLRPGATLDTLHPAEGPLPLPGFRLRLERSDLTPGDPGLRVYAWIPPAGPVAFPAQAGASAALGGGYRMDLLQVMGNAVATGQVVESPNAPATPALRVVLGLGLPEPLVGQLLAGSPQLGRQDEPGGRFAVVFREAWDDGLLGSLRPSPPSAEQLVLESQGRALEHSARPGDSWELPGFTLKVTRIFPDFAIRPGPDGQPEAYSRSDAAREPWAQLDLAQADGRVRRLLLSAREPEVSDRLNAANLPAGITLRYRRDGEEYQRRFVVFTRRDLRIRLLQDGRILREEPLVLQRPFIVEPGLSVTPEHLIERADPVLVAGPDGNAPGRHPALRARISDPRTGAVEERWLEARLPGGPAPVVRFLDGKVALSYRDRLPEAGDDHSELVILDAQDRELGRKLIGPGQPLDFGGFRFRQTRGDPDDPQVAGIEAVREPGLWLIRTGFASLLLGCVWMFYLKPALKRRARGAQEATS
jgi:hypothetical protein